MARTPGEKPRGASGRPLPDVVNHSGQLCYRDGIVFRTTKPAKDALLYGDKRLRSRKVDEGGDATKD
jgi:hypothetical protein